MTLRITPHRLHENPLFGKDEDHEEHVKKRNPLFEDEDEKYDMSDS